MARKKPGEKKDMEAVAETKFVRLELPLDTHRKLRIAAARAELRMAQLARIAVEEYLERHEPRGGR